VGSRKITPSKHLGDKKDANLASFTADAAAKSGKSARAIARDATRAKALGADLDRIKGAELDALASDGLRTTASLD
jgi:hypothetical protein